MSAVKKKVTKKVTKKAVKKVAGVSMTLKQAASLQAFLAKKGKSFKFLDTKIQAAS